MLCVTYELNFCTLQYVSMKYERNYDDANGGSGGGSEDDDDDD